MSISQAQVAAQMHALVAIVNIDLARVIRHSMCYKSTSQLLQGHSYAAFFDNSTKTYQRKEICLQGRRSEQQYFARSKHMLQCN